MLIILPRRRAAIERAAICESKKHELRLVSSTRSQLAASALSTPPGIAIPALLTRISTGPSARDLGYRGRQRRALGHIERARDRTHAPRAQLLEHGAVLALVAGEDRDRGAGRSKAQRDSAPDPAVAAGDHRHAAAQVEHLRRRHRDFPLSGSRSRRL